MFNVPKNITPNFMNTSETKWTIWNSWDQKTTDLTKVNDSKILRSSKCLNLCIRMKVMCIITVKNYNQQHENTKHF